MLKHLKRLETCKSVQRPEHFSAQTREGPGAQAGVLTSQLAALAFATVKGVYRQDSLTANSMIPQRMLKRFTELAENNIPVSPNPTHMCF